MKVFANFEQESNNVTSSQVICFCSILGAAQARGLKASLPIIPPLVETKDKGILVDLCKAIAEEYKDGKIT